ncbi:hypothetical protein [Hyphomicrobium sp.]|uniref:hypothetical protein n=1 Tax=Hyphomicrobium sp. TaxID=82 RepID=UPI002E2EF0E7|nr:hypothetical protein [Hyphomicrobium sp.]HEX2840997.1 hypothetical protein [Hyphomicrobium sp.]
MRERAEGNTAAGNDQGFVLVAVLLVALVLILVAVTFTYGVRSRVKSIASAVDSAEAEALADAGVQLAVMDLQARRSGSSQTSRFAAGSAAVVCAAPSQAGVIAIEVRDEAGKIDLNTNNEALLLALVVGLGTPIEKARPIVSRILDFRDGDSQARPDGAEAEDYAGRAPPKNRPFDAVEEIEQVLAIPPKLVLEMRPFLTVNSGAEGFDPLQAPPGLRDVIVRGAALTSETGFASSSAAMGQWEGIPTSFVSRSEGRAVSVLATGAARGGGRFTRWAILEAPQAGRGDFTIRRWMQAPSSVAADYNGEKPPC